MELIAFMESVESRIGNNKPSLFKEEYAQAIYYDMTDDIHNDDAHFLPDGDELINVHKTVPIEIRLMENQP